MPKGEKLYFVKEELTYTCTACGKSFRGIEAKVYNLFKVHTKYHHPSVHQEVEIFRNTAQYKPRTTQSELKVLTSMK